MSEKKKKKYEMPNLVKLSFGEEIGNSVSHGVMCVLLLFLLPYVAVISYLKGGAVLAASESIFIISMFLMFLASTLYHTMAYDTKHKYVFRKLDHIFIYVAIAGSYTPIALTIVGGPLGWTIFGLQWICVLFGIIYKSLSTNKGPRASIIIYLVMGWCAVLFIPQILEKTSVLFMGLIVLGGVFYTIGAWFYKQKDRPYFHFIWHLFINAACISHFIAIVFLMHP